MILLLWPFLSKPITSKLTNVDMRELASGIYMLQLNLDGEKIIEKIIKK